MKRALDSEVGDMSLFLALPLISSMLSGRTALGLHFLNCNKRGNVGGLLRNLPNLRT